MTRIDLSSIDADPEVLALLEAMQDELETVGQTGRVSKGVGKDGLIAALNDALSEATKAGKPKVVGRNEAFARIFRDGYEYEDGSKVEPADLLECFAKMLETNPGVTVDRTKLEMSPIVGQWALRVYNRPEVESLARSAKDTDG